jgi:hypothetical protein
MAVDAIVAQRILAATSCISGVARLRYLPIDNLFPNDADGAIPWQTPKRAIILRA